MCWLVFLSVPDIAIANYFYITDTVKITILHTKLSLEFIYFLNYYCFKIAFFYKINYEINDNFFQLQCDNDA